MNSTSEKTLGIIGAVALVGVVLLAAFTRIKSLERQIEELKKKGE